jgi:hypothetical protein
VLEDLEKEVAPVIARRNDRYTFVSHVIQHDLLSIMHRHSSLQPFDRLLKRFGIKLRLKFSVCRSLESLGI